jgi:hypothetical protein
VTAYSISAIEVRRSQPFWGLFSFSVFVIFTRCPWAKWGPGRRDSSPPGVGEPLPLGVGRVCSHSRHSGNVGARRAGPLHPPTSLRSKNYQAAPTGTCFGFPPRHAEFVENLVQALTRCLPDAITTRRLKTKLLVLLAIPAGLEPATLCLEGRCSIRLSYGTWPKFKAFSTPRGGANRLKREQAANSCKQEPSRTQSGVFRRSWLALRMRRTRDRRKTTSRLDGKQNASAPRLLPDQNERRRLGIAVVI